MTIACQSANSPSTPGGVTAPISLSAQSMTITPSASPCYDPCTVMVSVTWINDTSDIIFAGTPIGITVDGNTPINGSTTTATDVNPTDTITVSFAVTGLMSINTNIICPVPN